MKRLLLLALLCYQKTAATILGGQCRFYPSCSEYFKRALEKYGTGKAIYLSFTRILRCHPYHSGGIDLP